jgi:hypothetical protein
MTPTNKECSQCCHKIFEQEDFEEQGRSLHRGAANPDDEDSDGKESSNEEANSDGDDEGSDED